MNLRRFSRLMQPGSGPRQNLYEWQTFLELCELHLKTHGIEHPVVVELGTFKNRQKKFYEQLLNAEHIGININAKHEAPDIIGDTHSRKTLNTLKERLGPRNVNILFIDASHTYASVSQDYEMYAPLCSDIVAFHDIETGRYEDNKNDGAWRFWEELRTARCRERRKSADDRYMFISIHQRHFKDVKARALGIGVIIKR